jgi:DNA-binding MarR family transcriptional regulator
MAAPVGQTSARWQVLGVVDHGPATVAAVARTMGLARQSVQRTADHLADDGLLAYLDNPSDRRAQLVTLTAKGRKVLRTIEVAQANWAQEIGREIGETPLARTLDDLEKLEALLIERERK